MKAQGTVKGILVEGNDGHEYLLGFSRTQPIPTPTLFLWTAFKEALKAFPPVPSWPTWPA